MSPRRLAAVGAAGLAALLALPAPAFAHGIAGRTDLPIPAWLFGWAAGLVLVASFVALATLWPTPRLESVRERSVFRLPVVVDVAAGLLGVAVFGLVVYAGLAGTQSEAANLAPTAVYVVFWVGLAFASFLFGDVFRALSPWRAIARAASWVASRVSGERVSEPLPYPGWLGRWPAAAGLLAFAWVELVLTDGRDPGLLAVLALAYAAIQLVGMSLYGIDTWSDRADAFGVYFSLFARLSPFVRRDGVVHVRRPLAGAPRLDPLPGTVALLCVMIGSTTFDGGREGPLWNDVAPDLQELFESLGLGPDRALEAAFTLGLVACVLAVALLYRIAVAGMRHVGEAREGGLAGRFIHSLVPIALAYVVAHYFSLLVFQGQSTAALVSDPLGEGEDWFGTADAGVDYGVVSANAIWYVQVAALVCGHVAGLVLAHDRALGVYSRAREATRSQYWMLVVMVAFTCLGLWLLSAANQ